MFLICRIRIGKHFKQVANGITLFGDPANASNNKVSVRTLNGREELGTADSGYTFFDVTDKSPILDVKLEWKDGNAPTLYAAKLDKVKDSGNVESSIKAMNSR